MKTRVLVITSIIFLISLIPYSYAQDVSQPEVNVQKSMPPEPPQLGESVNNNVTSEDNVSIQTLLNEFYARNVVWYFIIGSIASLAVAWKLTTLRLVGVLGIFIIAVASYFLFPPLCQITAGIFKTHCGTGEKFSGAVPFSVSSLGFGILLLIYSYKSKNLQSSERIRK